MFESKNFNAHSDVEFVNDLGGKRTIPATTIHEIKSRRLQLLMKPTLHKMVKQTADDNGLSVNEFIHSVLESYLLKENVQ